MICRAHPDGGPQLERILHLRDLEEVLVVGDAQRAHAVLVPPLLPRPQASDHQPHSSSQLSCCAQGCMKGISFCTSLRLEQ